MALTLSQVVDLAIGTDVPSVNFLHLRDVLVTVITNLDIGGVVVKKTHTSRANAVLDGVGELENDPLLSDNTDQENGTNTGDDDDDHLSTYDSQNGDAIKHVDKTDNVTENTEGDINSNLQSLGRKSTLKGEQSTRIKSVKNSAKQTRPGNGLSKASNVASSHNSVLSNKVLALEEGLKRLRSIVGDLISKGDFSGNLSNSLMEQLKDAETNMESLETVSLKENDTPTQDSERSKGHSASSKGHPASARRRASARLSREISGKSISKRPVTQPVLDKQRHGEDPPVFTRSKTGDEVDGGKILSSKVSVLEKLKERRNITNIKQEASKNGKTGSTGGTKDGQGERVKVPHDTTSDRKVVDGASLSSGEDSSESETDVDSEAEMVEMIEKEIEAALNDPSDPKGPVYAVRLGLEQMQAWREKLLKAQEDFRLEVGTCKNSIQKMQNDLKSFRLARNAQDAESFNAVHHVHNLVLELDGKHTKTNKTVINLVDEFNRHEQTFSEVFDAVERLDEQKVDNVFLSNQVGNKANKDDLHDKVSLSTFDETFSLLDRGLGDALEKMANQMSMEEALRETLNELESGMESKLNRDEMDKLKYELENRIKEVRSMRAKGVEGTPRTIGDPAGFKRKMETVRCISCDRDMEIAPSQVPPSIPKVQRMVGNHVNKTQASREGNVGKKLGDEDEYRPPRIKTEMVQGTGLLDYTSVPMSQRFCGGSHTIMRGNKRSITSGTHFNDYVVIRNESNSVVSLPTREFIIPKEAGMDSRFMRKPRLPAIQEGGNYMKSDFGGFLPQEEDELGRSNRVEKKISSVIVGKIPVCKTEDE